MNITLLGAPCVLKPLRYWCEAVNCQFCVEFGVEITIKRRAMQNAYDIIEYVGRRLLILKTLRGFGLNQIHPIYKTT